MHLIGLLDRPTSGEYWLCGQPTSGLSARNRAALSRAHIGFVFQGASVLVPGMDALENAAVPLAFRGVSREKRLDCAADALCMVGLGARLHPHARNAVGRTAQQRVAIARALCTDPRPAARRRADRQPRPTRGARILDLFDRLHADSRTIVWITHDQQAAKRAERRILMHEGKLCPEQEN